MAPPMTIPDTETVLRELIRQSVPEEILDQFEALLFTATAAYADSLMLTMKARTDRKLFEEFAHAAGVANTFEIYYGALMLAKERVGIYAGESPQSRTKGAVVDPADLGRGERVGTRRRVKSK